MSNPYYGFSDDISRMCVALERIANSLKILAEKNSSVDRSTTDDGYTYPNQHKDYDPYANHIYIGDPIPNSTQIICTSYWGENNEQSQ